MLLVAPLLTLAVGVLALTGGLAAAGFVKAFGITFLAIPRSPAAEHAHEAPAVDADRHGNPGDGVRGLRAGRRRHLAGARGRARGSRAACRPRPPGFGSGLSLSMPGGFARMSPILVALGLVLVAAGAWLGVRVFGRRAGRSG